MKKLSTSPNKFTLNNVFQHYKGIVQSDSFNLATVSENTILTILKNNKTSKAAGLDNLSGRFLKDGAKVLAKPITVLHNLSITSGKFPDSCKIVQLKPIYKKGYLTEASVAFYSDFNMTHGDLCSVKYISVVNYFLLSRFESEKFLCLGEWKSLSRVLISRS